MARSYVERGRIASASKDSSTKAAPLAPPFPTRQMLILAICRICEPIAFMGIFPYVAAMIKDLNVTTDEKMIAMYGGLVTSVFTFAEFSTGFFWGRLSDRIGRKPVILMGMLGTALSVLIFGFAPNIWVALFARALGGFLNGNMGVLQSTITEMITSKEHQSRAYTVLPTVWSLGSVIGPMIGGALARPCVSYPNWFPRGTIWDQYPYLLPNLFSAFVVLVGVINGVLFLEETHCERKKRVDPGVEFGKWMLRKAASAHRLFGIGQSIEVASGRANSECEPLLGHQEQLPGYRSTEGSPNNSPRIGTTLVISEPQEPLDLAGSRPYARDAPRKIFSRTVVLNIVTFGILAFHTMTFDATFPQFLASGPPDIPVQPLLPFRFVYGMSYDTKTIGMILSAQGVYSLVITTSLVPAVIHRLGPLRTFRLIAASYFLLYLITPYVVLLPDSLRMAGVCVLYMWKCTFAGMMYPCNANLLANSAPSQLALGTINGVAASTASLSRSIAPILSGWLFSVGLNSGYSILPWWFSAMITVVGAFVAFQITEKRDVDEKALNDVEAAQPNPAMS